MPIVPLACSDPIHHDRLFGDMVNALAGTDGMGSCRSRSDRGRANGRRLWRWGSSLARKAPTIEQAVLARCGLGYAPARPGWIGWRHHLIVRRVQAEKHRFGRL